MRFCVLTYLIATAASIQVPVAPDADVAPPTNNIFQTIGTLVQKSINGRKGASEKAHEIAQSREDLALGRLNVLKANLPQLAGIAAQICSGPNGADLCEIRMKMFKSISDRIVQGDVKVVEMLRKSVQLLEDFLHMTDTLRSAISSLTLYELRDRPPEGMKLIADINPMDGNIDRYEWSEYMKAIYLFTLTDDTAHALEMKRKSSNRMREFVTWDQRDRKPPTLLTQSVITRKRI